MRLNFKHMHQRNLIFLWRAACTKFTTQLFQFPTMISNFIILAMVLTTLTSVHALECPASCPLVVSELGDSTCCSVGDETLGCGLCSASTCAGNNFAPCEETFGTVCNLDFPTCTVEHAGGNLSLHGFWHLGTVSHLSSTLTN